MGKDLWFGGMGKHIGGEWKGKGDIFVFNKWVHFGPTSFQQLPHLSLQPNSPMALKLTDDTGDFRYAFIKYKTSEEVLKALDGFDRSNLKVEGQTLRIANFDELRDGTLNPWPATDRPEKLGTLVPFFASIRAAEMQVWLHN